MIHTYFKDVSIISPSSRKGFHFKFSPHLNVIHGENDTGKSSLIKSLYYTLGGDLRLDTDWKKDNIITKVSIIINDIEYTFTRQNKLISIFKIDETPKLISSSINLSDTALTICKIFDFNLQLTLKSNGKQSLAYPACLFLPFYIDQDQGWHDVLCSFTGLRMYDDWQKNTLFFHTGIRPKEYYQLIGDIKTIQLTIKELNATLDAVLSAKDKFEKSFGRILFDIDIEYYQNLLNKFLAKCQDLYKEESKYRVKLISLLESRDEISTEIENNKKLIDTYAYPDLESYTQQYIQYEKRDEIINLIPNLYEEKEKINNKISSIRSELLESNALSQQLTTMIREVKGELTLQDIIRSQASKEIEATFAEQISDLMSKLRAHEENLNKIQSEQDKYTDPQRTKKINDLFKLHLQKSQLALNIGTPIIAPIVQYNKITKGKTGSRGPRSIFAYHYSLLKTIQENTSTSMLPIVIDSPKQQDLDHEKTKQLISLCVSGFGANNQIIIGTVFPEDNMVDWNKLELKVKYNLLSEEKYQEAFDDIQAYQRLLLRIESDL